MLTNYIIPKIKRFQFFFKKIQTLYNIIVHWKFEIWKSRNCSNSSNSTNMMNRRLVKELEMLAVDPGPGIAVWKNDESINNLFASMTGPENSPYEDGVFQLSVNIPDR